MEFGSYCQCKECSSVAQNRPKRLHRRNRAKTRAKRLGFLIRRDGAFCFYCERALGENKATFDHVEPRSKGGYTNTENLVLACGKCNNRKGDKSFIQFVIEENKRISPERKKYLLQYYYETYRKIL